MHPNHTNGINAFVRFRQPGYSFGNCRSMNLSSAPTRQRQMPPSMTRRKIQAPPPTIAGPCDRQPHAKSGYCARAATYWRDAGVAERLQLRDVRPPTALGVCAKRRVPLQPARGASVRSVHRWISEIRCVPSPSALSDFERRGASKSLEAPSARVPVAVEDVVSSELKTPERASIRSRIDGSAVGAPFGTNGIDEQRANDPGRGSGENPRSGIADGVHPTTDS
jgi:hypothetical protein